MLLRATNAGVPAEGNAAEEEEEEDGDDEETEEGRTRGTVGSNLDSYLSNPDAKSFPASLGMQSFLSKNIHFAATVRSKWNVFMHSKSLIQGNWIEFCG